jgi:hypothetical protein
MFEHVRIRSGRRWLGECLNSDDDRGVRRKPEEVALARQVRRRFRQGSAKAWNNPSPPRAEDGLLRARRFCEPGPRPLDDMEISRGERGAGEFEFVT